MDDRSSLETSDLLQAAVQRAANIRNELVQLREQAFAEAASAQPAGTASDTQLAASAPGAGTPATLALPPPAGGKPLVLPVMLLPAAGGGEQPGAACMRSLSFLMAGGSSGGLPDALLHVGAPSPGALPTGERGAAPKSSGGGGDTSLLSGGSWSIPAGPAAVLPTAAWQLGAAPPQHDSQPWTPAAAPAAAALAAAALPPPRDGSFDAVLAALQAEADQQQQQLAVDAALGAAAGGSIAVRSSRMRSSPGARHRHAGTRSVSRSGSRQGGPAATASQRRCAQQLPTFDRTDAERQLRDKLNQVNAAKRFNDTRQRPAGPGRSAASQGVPHLPLESLSKGGSVSAGDHGSAARGAQLPEHSQFVWHGAPMAAAPLLRSPVRGRSRSRSAAGSRAAGEEQEGGLNFLPLARDERRGSPLRCPSGSTAATAGSAAALAQPQAGRRQSHVSLSDLLDSSSRGTAAGTAGSAQQTVSGLRRSAFSAAEVAGSAADQQAGVVAPDAAASTAEPPSVQAEASFAQLAEAQAHAQQQAVAAATAAAAAAAVLPGEAAAPPMQDTPRQPGAVGRTRVEGATGAAEGGLMGRLLGQLASPMGKLQSPPSTPHDAAASAAAAAAAGLDGEGCAAPVATEASSTSDSSGVASTASSGSPDQRLGSPVRRFPGLASQPSPAGQQQQPQQQAPQQQAPQQQGQQAGQPSAGQQQQGQQRATPSAGASGSRLATAGSASSIGRKRSNSEVALEEPPASVKKRSPEVGRLLPRASAEWGSSGGAAAAALAAAASGPPSLVSGLVAAPAVSEGQQQQQGLREEQAPEREQPPAGKGQLSSSSAASPEARRSPLALRQAEPAETVSGSRVVVPVVLQHSPRGQRRQPASPHICAGAPAVQHVQQEQQAQQAQQAQQQEAAQPKPGAAPAQAGAEREAGAKAAANAPRPAVAAAAAAHPVRPLRPAVPPLPLQRELQGERQPPFLPRLPVAAAAAAAAAEAEPELPSYSRWVASPREQQQQQPAVPAQQRQGTPAPRQAPHRLSQGSPVLASSSVLVGRGPQAAAAAYIPAVTASPGTVLDSPQACSPADLPASALARRVAQSAAAASPRILATPRRRLASLEPPTPRCQAAPCLRQDEHGKQLLAAAPDLADMAGGALLDAMRQGTVVRKAWVRPNFKAGGSVRRMQLAPGSGGRAELLYPHGLFRKPLRFAVRRAVVNCPAWRPGAYIVLDTARGMLRLEPATAAEYTRWVLALNAAFLASAAGAGAAAGSSGSDSSGRGSGDCRLLPVGSHRWSAAILFG